MPGRTRSGVITGTIELVAATRISAPFAASSGVETARTSIPSLSP